MTYDLKLVIAGAGPAADRNVSQQSTMREAMQDSGFVTEVPNAPAVVKHVEAMAKRMTEMRAAVTRIDG